jgi:hypothetical protein
MLDLHQRKRPEISKSRGQDVRESNLTDFGDGGREDAWRANAQTEPVVVDEREEVSHHERIAVTRCHSNILTNAVASQSKHTNVKSSLPFLELHIRHRQIENPNFAKLTHQKER